MTKKQQAAYDRTCQEIHERFGSNNAIAIQSHRITDTIITGETVRQWISERRIPAEFVFVLYELMDFEIDPLTLLPWLGKWVTVKPMIRMT